MTMSAEQTCYNVTVSEDASDPRWPDDGSGMDTTKLLIGAGVIAGAIQLGREKR